MTLMSWRQQLADAADNATVEEVRVNQRHLIDKILASMCSGCCVLSANIAIAVCVCVCMSSLCIDIYMNFGAQDMPLNIHCFVS